MKSFADESLDFIYIDGDHSYKAVKADFEAWWPKIRPGGYVFGDDYGSKGSSGVKPAIDQFARKVGVKVNIIGWTAINKKHGHKVALRKSFKKR